MNYDHAVYCELATFCTVLHNVNGLGFLKVSLQIFFSVIQLAFLPKKKKKDQVVENRMYILHSRHFRHREVGIWSKQMLP